ncbi:MAG: MaoC family dehydratase N-terminal domain-containing protein [Acidimicrobiales bacterium]
MAIDAFHVEASHIMMFARSIGDDNPRYDPLRSDPAEVMAPPTFVQASAQFDPDYVLRPSIDADGWFGSGGEPTGRKPSGGSKGGGGNGGGLHAEQHFVYHRPLKAGDVLTATTSTGKEWEKTGGSGTLRFSERVTEYRDANGELVVTATGVGVVVDRSGTGN